MRNRRGVIALMLALVVCVGVVCVGVPFGVTDDVFAAKTTSKSATTTAKTGKPSKTGKTSKTTKKVPKITLGAVRQTQLARDQVRAKRAKAASKVNALKATQHRATQALADLTSNVRVTSVALDQARRSAAKAADDAVNAQTRQRSIESSISKLSASRLESALEAYAQPAASSLDSYLDAGDAAEAGRRQILDKLSKRGTANALDELQALQEDLNIQRILAERAQRKASSYRTAVAKKLARFQSARKKQGAFADQLENRLEAQLSEAAALADLDKGLSARLSSQNDALAKQLAAVGAGGRGGGKLSVAEIAAGGGGDTHGIRVAAAIRGKLAAMVAAAQRDGVFLTGGGYRSPAAQVQLRIAHCGSSSFAIYQARASSCRPPTARPGASMHERGLAVDFQEGGRTLTRGSRGYGWLRKNAAKYGFFNLPSEAWHWSVNGR